MASPYFTEPKSITPAKQTYWENRKEQEIEKALTDEGVTGDQQRHAHYDEKALVHGHEDGLHQHLQSGVLPSDRAEPGFGQLFCFIV